MAARRRRRRRRRSNYGRPSRGHFPVSRRALPHFRVLSELHFRFPLHVPCLSRFSSATPPPSLSSSARAFVPVAREPRPPAVSSSLLSISRFGSYAFISLRAPSTLSRQLRSHPHPVVDINKHLDYTVKAASTTSPD